VIRKSVLEHSGFVKAFLESDALLPTFSGDNLQNVFKQQDVFHQESDEAYIACIAELASAFKSKQKKFILIVDGVEEAYLVHHFDSKDQFKFLDKFLEKTFDDISDYRLCLITASFNIFSKLIFSHKLFSHYSIDEKHKINEFYEVTGTELSEILTKDEYERNKVKLAKWYQINRSTESEIMEDRDIKFNPNSVIQFCRNFATEKNIHKCFKIYSRGSCYADYLSQEFLILKDELSNFVLKSELTFKPSIVSAQPIREMLIYATEIDVDKRNLFFTILLAENLIY